MLATVAIVSLSAYSADATTIQTTDNSYPVSIDNTPSIEVRGKAIRKVSPDKMTLSIVIDEADYKGKTTLSEKQETMIDILHDCKVPVQESLKVGTMGSSMTITSFRKVVKTHTKATYLLELRDVQTMQEVIRKLGEEGISHIDLLKTEYTKKAELEDALGVEAAKDARRRAELISEAIGETLGHAIQVYVRPMYSNDITPRLRTNMYMAESSSSDMVAEEALEPHVSLSSAQMEFSVEVTAKFQITKGAQ